MIAPARRAALEALRLIEEEQLDLGGAVARVRGPLEDERDRALLLDLVSGTSRMRGAIDYQLSIRSSRPLHKLDAVVLRILRLAGYQLLYSTRLPASAVINDAVNLTRKSGKSSAAGLTNAVLRALARDCDALAWPPVESLVDHLAAIHSHPQWLIERWLSRYGRESTEAWLRFNNQPAQVCLAVNRLLGDRDTLASELLAAGVSTAPTSRAEHGLNVMDGRPMATEAFEAGRFVIQDEASQLIAELAQPPAGGSVLDLCASPGGKTLALSAAVGAAGSVTACDVRPNRLRLLERTLTRCRVENARIVLVGKAGLLPFDEQSFDTVLIDAPCSGLGTVRRDPDIRWKRSPEDLPRFAVTQRDLLARAASLVKKGGTLVYATCSSEPEENDDVVNAFLAAHPEFSMRRRHQTLPFQDGLEAFFGAVLERSSEPSPEPSSEPSSEPSPEPS